MYPQTGSLSKQHPSPLQMKGQQLDTGKQMGLLICMGLIWQPWPCKFRPGQRSNCVWAKAQIHSPRGLQQAAGSEGPVEEVPLKSEGAGSLCSGRGPCPAGWAPEGPREAGQGIGITFLR